ncbi:MULTISPECIES: bacteriohopanetetrol glucosamine biosynthesis glycosyltransferase HpnI [Sphingomonas]|uniref:bacteriohopanetetrol glucosamine biosynthesis glycosyltransferase HpnI n=1 Tax=Sphingomonas TaxID=13687 RepID=UPI00082DF31F|nr:bacteriohopanetetrol glucosamine biosynthesis glycosyltransferase HpnI [Sphingomonas sp. CCH10-B3]
MSTFAILLLGMAAIGTLFNLAAAALVRPVRAMRPRDQWPSVTVLKPLHGLEPSLEANLETVFTQAYPGPVQVVFGTSSASDPAIALAARVADRHPDAVVARISSARMIGANKKLCNLSNMAEFQAHDIVVIADSDVAWAPDTLARVVDALDRPGVGLVSCRHVGRGDAGFWSRVAAMDIAYRFMPSVILGRAVGLAQPVLGPTMALRAETLAAIGGFPAFVDLLADDYEIGRAVRGMGLTTELSDFFIVQGCSEPTLGALFSHELRWSLTVFRIDPFGFAGSVLTHAVPLALLAVLVSAANPAAIAWLALAFVSRLVVKLRMDRATGFASGPAILLPLRDLLSCAIFVATFFIDKVDWRGSQFRVTRDGKLQLR